MYKKTWLDSLKNLLNFNLQEIKLKQASRLKISLIVP